MFSTTCEIKLLDGYANAPIMGFTHIFSLMKTQYNDAKLNLML